MIRLPQLALCLALLAAALPALVGLIVNGFTMASVGWESFVIWSVSAVSAAALWDRKLRLPSGPTAIVLTTLAVAAFATRLINPQWDLSATGATLTIMLVASGFARRADQTSLAGFVAVALPASLAASPIVSAYLSDLVIGWATTMAGDLLHLANIAHVTHGDVVTTAGERFAVTYRMQSWASWPVIAALALLYSALMGRNWLHSFLMAVTAAPLCAAFHSGTIAMVSASEVWQWQWLPTGAWPWISALATAVAMLSADRVLELLLKVIEPDDNASRANPVVHAWNQFVTRPKVRDRQPSRSMIVVYAGSATILLVLGGMALPVAMQGIAILKQNTRHWDAVQDVTDVVRDGELTVDHFALDRFVHRQWGRVSDVWLATGPDALVELTMSQVPRENPGKAFFLGTRWSAIAAETTREEHPPSKETDAESARKEPPEELPSDTTPESKIDAGAAQETTVAEANAVETSPSTRPDLDASSERSSSPVAEMKSQARFELPEVASGIEVMRLVAAQQFDATKDSGHAIVITCRLTDDGAIISDTQTPPTYWVRLVRRSAMEPNARQGRELAEQFSRIVAAVAASLEARNGG